MRILSKSGLLHRHVQLLKMPFYNKQPCNHTNESKILVQLFALLVGLFSQLLKRDKAALNNNNTKTPTMILPIISIHLHSCIWGVWNCMVLGFFGR